MNKIISLLLVSILMVSSVVLAEERTNMPSKDNGINNGEAGEKLVGVGLLRPGNLLYFLDIAFDRIKIAISRNKENTRVEIAKERLAELNTATTEKQRQKILELIEKEVAEINNLDLKREVVTIGMPIIIDDIDYDREKLEIIKIVNNDRWAKRFLQGWDYLIIKVVGFKDRSWRVNINPDGSIKSIDDFTYKPPIIVSPSKPMPKPPIICMAQFICPDGSSRTGCGYEDVCGKPIISGRDTGSLQQTALAEPTEIQPKRPTGNGFTIVTRSQTLRNAIRAKGSMSFLQLLSLVQQIETEPKEAKLQLISKVEQLFKEYGNQRASQVRKNTDEQKCIKENGKWYDGQNNCLPSSNPTALCRRGCLKTDSNGYATTEELDTDYA